MTIKELILENDNFAHSEEAFNIYKESCELNVLNAWIECQEHKAFTNASVFTEADDTALDAAKEKASAKEEALHKKIWNAIKATAKKVWNAIIKIINKVLRVFGVMKTAALSDAQKEALLKGEWKLQSEVASVLQKIVAQYKGISHVTDDSFTNLGDRGTRKLATALAGKDASKVDMMAAIQLAYFLTGQKELVAPSVTIAHGPAKSGAVTQLKALPYMIGLIRDNKELTEEGIVAKQKAYRTYDISDLESATKELGDLVAQLNDSETTVAELGGHLITGDSLTLFTALANRDLKIFTSLAVIQGLLKSLGDKIAADASAETEKK
jgi:hypothetical protein